MNCSIQRFEELLTVSLPEPILLIAAMRSREDMPMCLNASAGDSIFACVCPWVDILVDRVVKESEESEFK